MNLEQRLTRLEVALSSACPAVIWVNLGETYEEACLNVQIAPDSPVNFVTWEREVVDQQN